VVDVDEDGSDLDAPGNLSPSPSPSALLSRSLPLYLALLLIPTHPSQHFTIPTAPHALNSDKTGKRKRSSLWGRKEYRKTNTKAGVATNTTRPSTPNLDDDDDDGEDDSEKEKEKGVRTNARGTNNEPDSNARGKAEVRYQCQGEVPHSLLRLSTVLNSSTASSGHSIRCQKNESTNTLTNTAAALNIRPRTRSEGKATHPCHSDNSNIGSASSTISQRNTAQPTTKLNRQ